MTSWSTTGISTLMGMGSKLISDADRTYGRGGCREMVVVLVVVTATMAKAKGKSDGRNIGSQKYRKKD